MYLRITVNGKSSELSTKALWDPERWNAASGRASGSKEDARTINNLLDSLNAKVYQAKKMLLDSDRVVTADAIKNALKGKDGQSKMLLVEFKYHNNQMAALVGTEFAPLTLKRYNTALDHTRSFIEWKYGRPDKELRELSYDFISEFAFWLKSHKKCGHNTTVKYLSNVKKIVLLCVRKKWLRTDPFSEYKLVKKPVIKMPLTQQELNAIIRKKFEVERVSQVRDIFVFCCYTGLAYIDVKQLKRSEIAKGIDGEDWIFSNRQKTDASIRIPLLPKAKEIMLKYSDHPECSKSGCLLPVLSNQKMNAYLKEVADLCGVSTTLTSHIARHTFATTVTLSNNVPLETVSRLLGHKSLKQTQHYAKLLDNKIGLDMQLLRSKIQSLDEM